MRNVLELERNRKECRFPQTLIRRGDDMNINEMLETLSDAINALDANNETAIADNMMEIIAYIKSVNGMEEE